MRTLQRLAWLKTRGWAPAPRESRCVLVLPINGAAEAVALAAELSPLPQEKESARGENSSLGRRDAVLENLYGNAAACHLCEP